MKYIVLENIRSAYNVWNIIRSAECLWWWVILVWYTPSPFDDIKVKKTSLWAENNLEIFRYNNIEYFFDKYKNEWIIISWEITEKAINLKEFDKKNYENKNIFLILWNEVLWVSEYALLKSNFHLKIEMKWKKSSLNVWQASAIFMWWL